MQMVIPDDCVERIESIVNEFAPSAADDYTIEDL